MPYPSVDLLVAAAEDLKGSHPLAVITIPAILRAAHEAGADPLELQPFGTRQERPVLQAFDIVDDKANSKPYLPVWDDPPKQLLNKDYSGSGLQRLRTLDDPGRSIFKDDLGPGRKKRTQIALASNAGAVLSRLEAHKNSMSKASLAAWLGRREQFTSLQGLVTWFDEHFPLSGTDLELFYHDAIPSSLALVAEPFSATPARNAQIADRMGIVVNKIIETQEPPPAQAPEKPQESLDWTREFSQYPLADCDIQAITASVLDDLHARHIELPDEASLVRRCVTALLVGHLVLQGPPGTGKTTLARALARGFHSRLVESTATSDWSPFHVVGGFQPNSAGGLTPAHGKVTATALVCAEIVKNEIDALDADGELTLDIQAGNGAEANGDKAAWLFIDEFNRADIDKAIGSLYTLLSSCDPEHMAETPIDLWFESEPDRRRLWVPARFRIVAAMNDLDTSFVNRISQGLTRRFQFVTVGVPTVRATADTPVTSEIENAFAGAYEWVVRNYGSMLNPRPQPELRSTVSLQLEQLQRVIDGLRSPSAGPGWPVGTAQVVDVLRIVLLRVVAQPGEPAQEALDYAVADRLVPQMAGLDQDQVEAFTALFEQVELPASAQALRHMDNPHGLT